jgi:hypothetical protein
MNGEARDFMGRGLQLRKAGAQMATLTNLLGSRTCPSKLTTMLSVNGPESEGTAETKPSNFLRDGRRPRRENLLRGARLGFGWVTIMQMRD